MQDLIAQERFEMEVLDRLNSGRLLRGLIFGGGTMLRLCHGLDRFSVDLDFLMLHPQKEGDLFISVRNHLSRYYQLTDAADKLHTLLYELRLPSYPRSLKIEIRTESREVETEQAIAFSPHSTKQVLLYVVTLRAMMVSKVAAFLDRGEIRDAFDMEFLVKKGIKTPGVPENRQKILSQLEALTKKDYSVKLGSLLEAEMRSYYRQKNFAILKAAIHG